MTDKFTLSKELGVILSNKKLICSVAESCTGGGLAHAITSVSGSSTWFDRGFVTYTNTAKTEMLGVSNKTLKQFGAVSQEVALEMVVGCYKNSHADISASVTGIAGPTGGSLEKPVGTVWMGFKIKNNTTTMHHVFTGDRNAIREQTINYVLKSLIVFAYKLSI